MTLDLRNTMCKIQFGLNKSKERFEIGVQIYNFANDFQKKIIKNT